MLNKFVSNITDALDFNQATLSGCIDVIVVDCGDGLYKSSPFHVRFGKLKVLKTKEKILEIEVNDQKSNLKMKLGSAGEAYFEETVLVRTDTKDSAPSSPYKLNSSYSNSDTDGVDPKILHKIDQALEEKKMMDESSISREENKGSPGKKRWAWMSGKKDKSKKEQIKDNSSGNSFMTDEKLSPFSAKSKKTEESFSKDISPMGQSKREKSKKAIGSFLGKLRKQPETDTTQKKDKTLRQESFLSEPNKSNVSMNSTTIDLWDDVQSARSLKSGSKRPTPEVNRQRILSQEMELETLSTNKIDLSEGLFTPDKVQKVPKDEDFKDLYEFEGDAKQISPMLITNYKKYHVKPKVELSLCKNKVQEDTEDLDDVFSIYKVDYLEYVKDPMKIISNSNLVIRIDGKYYEGKIAIPLLISNTVFKTDLPDRVLDQIATQQNLGWRKWLLGGKNKDFNAPRIGAPQKSIEELDFPEQLIAEKGMTKKLEHQVVGEGSLGDEPQMFLLESPEATSASKTRLRKFLRPTSDMLHSLNLKPGVNKVRYIVRGAFMGDQAVEGSIYLWPKHTKIVISDVDGTITRSDVWGQIMPLVGSDWSHKGIASLYDNVYKNGYKILYLTARAIGQSFQTRSYLNSVSQDNVSLPPGPVILSPDRVISSFKREIIQRKPEVFKIACLRDIKNIFPADHNPFFAGFGNRDTDAIAYRAVGIVMNNIFIINPQGEIQQLNNSLMQTYRTLTNITSQTFPLLKEIESHVPTILEQMERIEESLL